jgi:hypothetical protein
VAQERTEWESLAAQGAEVVASKARLGLPESAADVHCIADADRSNDGRHQTSEGQLYVLVGAFVFAPRFVCIYLSSFTMYGPIAPTGPRRLT